MSTKDRKNTLGKNGNAFVITMVVLGVLALAIVAFFYFAKEKQQEEEPVHIPNFPLRMRSLVDAPVQYEVRNLSDAKVDSGIMKPGLVEQFLGAKSNQSYFVRVWGPHHYYEEFPCIQVEENDICELKPERIAEPDVTFDNGYLNIYAHEDLIKQTLVCVAWQPITRAVFIKDYEIERVPSRLSTKVDRCYGVGNIQGKVEFTVDIRKTERVPQNITFIIVDREVDTDFDYTYEVDTGMPDEWFTVTV